MPERERPTGETVPEDDQYGGYANYPTWAVHLWLANTEDTYYEAKDLLKAAGGPHKGAKNLQAWIEGMGPLEESSMYADILAWALQAVDWDEVARALGPQEWEALQPPTAPSP